MLPTWQAEPFLQFDTNNHPVCLGLQPALHKDSRVLKGVGISQTGRHEEKVHHLIFDLHVAPQNATNLFGRKNEVTGHQSSLKKSRSSETIPEQQLFFTYPVRQTVTEQRIWTD